MLGRDTKRELDRTFLDAGQTKKELVPVVKIPVSGVAAVRVHLDKNRYQARWWQ